MEKEKLKKYLYYRDKLNKSRSKKEAEAYFEKARRLLEERNGHKQRQDD